jgi:hypothetical protein
MRRTIRNQQGVKSTALSARGCPPSTGAATPGAAELPMQANDAIVDVGRAGADIEKAPASVAHQET